MLAVDAPKMKPISERIDIGIQNEVEQFYYREARLLDWREYEEWFELLDESIRYFMPIRTNRLMREQKLEFSKYGELAHFDDDKKSMRSRLTKLLSDRGWAENPASRTRHLISNVIVDHGERDDELIGVSAFIVYRNRSEHQVDIFAGERRDILVRSDNPHGFKIKERVIILDQSIILANNISVFF